jgi:putative ABC transport system permease protein
LNVIEGRDFRNTDGREAPLVAVVNQALAEKYFKGTTAVGKKFWLFTRNSPPTEIVGVVSNGRTNDLTRGAEPEIYASLWQRSAFSKDLIVRTAGDPRSIAAAVQRELRTVDPTAAAENVKTMEQIRDDSLASRTFAMQLLVGFAVIGTLLTMLGIMDVVAVGRVTARELAIRSAWVRTRRHPVADSHRWPSLIAAAW